MWRPGGGTSRLTYRRLRALLDGLPQESQYLTRLRDALTLQERDRIAAEAGDRGHGPWSRAEMLTALLVDVVQQQTWVLAEWEQGKRPPPPNPLPRPGVEDRAKPRTVDELRSRVSDLTWRRAEALRAGLPLPTE